MPAEKDSNDLLLVQGQYLFMVDRSKGVTSTLTGPYKTTVSSNTDQPVFWEKSNGRLVNTSAEQATKQYITVPDGSYVVVENPAKSSLATKEVFLAGCPKPATSNSTPELDFGKQVTIVGPCTFALWPGQSATVIEGHLLRSNQYLVVQVHNEQAARTGWAEAIVKLVADSAEAKSGEDKIDPAKLTVGQQLIIKGTEVSFFIPPSGAYVVPENKQYVRDAVSLERLEYCILLSENGEKRVVRGPSVVFPKPTEMFQVQDGIRKFRAIELNEISGIYIKVIAEYKDENEVEHKEGEELFITGATQAIYFPRPEHAIIKYDDQVKHHAIALPSGDSRYVLNRLTGVVTTALGPRMLLPDPRTEVVIKRPLSDEEVKLWFPGNQKALDVNRELRKTLGDSANFSHAYMSSGLMPNAGTAFRSATVNALSVATSELKRGTQYTPPRTITLDNKYDGAVTIDIWPGYAVMVVSKSGDRQVIKGPKTIFLNYDQSLHSLSFSTGTPKSDSSKLRTPYLQVQSNRVSDLVEVETKDFCTLAIHVSYRLNFEGEPLSWFSVDNYVQFLVEHLRSLIRNAAKNIEVSEFYQNATKVIRDTILGEATPTGRSGRSFLENGMHVYDVEVLKVTIQDTSVEEALVDAQRNAFKVALDRQEEQRNFEFLGFVENIRRRSEGEKAETAKVVHQYKMFSLERTQASLIAEKKIPVLSEQAILLLQQDCIPILKDINEADVERTAARQLQERTHTISLLQAEINAVKEKAQAVSPQLIAALTTFAQEQVLTEALKSLGPMGVLGKMNMSDMLGRLTEGTVLENLFKTLGSAVAEHVGSNGD
jgi:major vault protein